MILRIFLILVFTNSLLFSQDKEAYNTLKEELRITSEKFSEDPLFQKLRTFFLQKKWDSTLVYTSKQLNVHDLDGEVRDFCYFFRGISLGKKGLLTESKKEFLQISDDFWFIENTRMKLGDLMYKEGDFEKALEYYEKIESIKDSDLRGIKREHVYHNMGLSYMQLEKFDIASKYLLKSLEYQKSKKDTAEIFGCYTDLANLYYVQYKDDEAIPYFRKAYDISKIINDFGKKGIGALNMSIVEENRKDYIKALKYRKEYERWKDSLNDQNRIYETAQLEKKIAVEQKEKEVQVLEAENKAQEAQNRVYLYSGILLGVLLIIVFVSYKGTSKRNKIITAQKEDLDALNATKDKLFSIVSHDLRSSVNAIKTSNKKLLDNLEIQDKKEITTSLQQNSAIVNGAYGLLDNLLNWALLQTKQAYFEMTDLSLYHIVSHVAFNYQPILQEKDIAYVNSISRKTQVFADQESLKIILRNLLDNAIKFSKEGDKIHIYSEEQEEGFIDLVVEDFGMGMDQQTQEELLKDTQLLSKKKHEDILGTGLGLHLVKSMVAKNQGKFNIKSELGKGTKMIISLQKTNTA